MNTLDFKQCAFLKLFLLGVALIAMSVLACRTDKDANTKPNILFIFADQMAAHGMGCMDNPDVKTPHLDKLAAQGMLFRNAYSTNPVFVHLPVPC